MLASFFRTLFIFSSFPVSMLICFETTVQKERRKLRDSLAVSKIPTTQFFKSSTFISITSLKLAKSPSKAQQHPEADFCCLKIIPIFHPCYHPKLIWDILKNAQKTSVSVLMRTWLIIMKMRPKMINKSHRYEMNKTRLRHR